MTPEGRVKKEVKTILDAYSAYQHWPVQAGYGKPTLDCIGCHVGCYFAVETKAPGKSLTARQEDTKADIEAAGGIVFVIGERDLKEEHGGAYFNGYRYSGLAELEMWLIKQQTRKP